MNSVEETNRLAVIDVHEEGVDVPDEIIKQSKEKKKAHRTLRQMPIYRDMANMKYMVAKLYQETPRKLTKYIDCMLNTVSEAKKCVGLFEASMNEEMRIEYISAARALSEDLLDDVTILHKLNIIGNQTETRMKKQAKSIVAQSVALRDYLNGQGAK